LKTTPRRAKRDIAFLGLLALALALSACGGGQEAAGPGSDLRFKARASATVASGASAPAISAAERAEVQQRSLTWAVNSLHSAQTGTNALTVPPLYFGMVFSVEAAADGETLRELHGVFPPVTSGSVRAELQRGLQRKLRAGETTILGTAFLDAVTLAERPGTLASLSLQPLDANQLRAEPNLRASIVDSIAASLPLNVLGVSQATWTSPSGSTSAVSVLRIGAPTLALSGTGWTGQALRAAGDQWLVKIEPLADMATWGRAELRAALETASTSLAQPGVATDAVWELPQIGLQSTSELGDIRGLTLAQDRVNANLRFLDGGGTYLQLTTADPRANMSIHAAGLSYGAFRQIDFIFNPLNLFGGGSFSSGATNATINFNTCPSATLSLRPFYLAVLQPSGNIALLSRLNTFGGTGCTRLIVIGPG
jgi:hypothetical protein